MREAYAMAASSRRRPILDREHAVLGRQHMRLPRAFDVDGGAVDDQRALSHGGNAPVPDAEHMLAGRQHGDDDIGALEQFQDSLTSPCNDHWRLRTR